MVKRKRKRKKGIQLQEALLLFSPKSYISDRQGGASQISVQDRNWKKKERKRIQLKNSIEEGRDS